VFGQRNINMPDWVRAMLAELTKPPYFLMGGERPFPPAENMTSDSNPKNDNHSARPQQSSSTHTVVKSSTRENQSREKRVGRSSSQSAPMSYASNATAKPNGKAVIDSKFVNNSADIEKDAPALASGATRRWRATLIQAGIPPTLPALYGWKVKEVQPVANIVRIKTVKREFAVKQTHIRPERVQFLQQLCRFVRQNGFRNVPRFAVTSKKEPYVEHDGNTFYATVWVNGNAANFANLTHIGHVATALAQFHEASRGFETTDYHPPMEFALGQMTRRRADDLRSLIMDAELKKDPDEFDEMLIELGPSLRQDAEESIRMLDDEMCQAFLNREEETPGICHLDVIPGNFIYDGEGHMHLIDLDLATYAPRAMDIAHLLRRSLQLLNWNSEVAYACFVHYDEVRRISLEEYKIVEALLRFPYRAWRLANTRYRLFSDPEQIEDLRAYRVQEERRQAFLSAFTRELERRT
jgi:CotS family spore coat protein